MTPADPARSSSNTSDTDAVFARIAAYYDTLVAEHGHSPRSSDYGSPQSQQIKFDVLGGVMPLAGKRVLDVGCGLADFAPYLATRYPGCRYTGVDLSPRTIALARTLHPGVDLRVGNFLTDSFEEPFDVVTANGIFYLLGDAAAELMPRLIEKMFAIAREAVAFNSLSTWAPTREGDEFHADPAATLDGCRRLTSRVTLRHDYHPRDFTLYLYRGPR